MTKITVDPRQLQRVFENLLDNAIKFTQHAGEILISTNETVKQIIVQVKDCGPGIAVDELPFIFDAFHQHQASSTGHGLGLAAVRSHGERVALQNVPQQGAIFTVRLPKK